MQFESENRYSNNTTKKTCYVSNNYYGKYRALFLNRREHDIRELRNR